MPADRGTPRPAVGLLFGLLVALVVVVSVATPWHPLPGAVVTSAPVHRFFSPAQIAASNAYFDAARWPAWFGLLAGLTLAALLVLAPLGGRLVGTARRRTRRWWLQVVALVVLVTLLQQVVELPFGVWAQHLATAYGLSTQSWLGWGRDLVTSWLIAVVLTSVGMLVVVGLARRFRVHWYLPAAGAAAVLVLLGSFAYPVVIEPLFNSFTSLPTGPLRTGLLRLAQRDGVQVSDVLVSDASTRTTELNAYVSGFGATKRIVLYDTLLRTTPRRQIEEVVAHELGHAKANDVLIGTAEGALGAAAAVVGLFVVLRPTWLRRRVDAASAADPAIVPLVLGLVVLASFFALPLQDTVSRQIEARADAHALDLTRQPGVFIALQKRLALSNRSHLQPNPILSFWFSDHPPTLDRIGMALAWERLHGGGP